jgi:hypothetical protein
MTCSSAGIAANEVRDGHLLRGVQGAPVPTKDGTWSGGKDVDARPRQPKAGHDGDKLRCLTGAVGD